MGVFKKLAFVFLCVVAVLAPSQSVFADGDIVYDVEGVPVREWDDIESMDSSNMPLKIRYVYDKDATPETLDEDLDVLVEESTVNPDSGKSINNNQQEEFALENVSTGDKILIFGVFAVLFAILVLLVIFSQKSRIRRPYRFVLSVLLLCLSISYPLTLNNESMALDQGRYAANEDDSSLFDLAPDMGSDSNFVVFANMCWRVIGNNEYGTRLAYYGERTELGECSERSFEDLVSDGLLIEQSDLTESHGFYTYNDQMADMRSAGRTIDEGKNYPGIINYTEGECYRKFIEGNFDDSMRRDTNGGIYCDVDKGAQYSSDSMYYNDGHFYLRDAQVFDEFFEGTLYCRIYLNGCAESNIRFYPAVVDSPDRREIAEHNETYMRFYVCILSRGATMLDDGTVDCGDNFEVHKYNFFSSFKYSGQIETLTLEKPIDSPMKTKIESWFENKGLTEYQDDLADAPFCINSKIDGDSIDGDYNFYPGSSNYGLTLEANLVASSDSGCTKNDLYSVSASTGNGLLKYPVGPFVESNDETGLTSWTSNSYSIYVLPSVSFDLGSFKAKGSLYGTYSGARLIAIPTITIKAGKKVANGFGSNDRPFVLDGESFPEILPHMVTLRIEEDALFEGLVTNFNLNPNKYLFSYDENSHTITFDDTRDVELYLSGFGITNITPLKYISRLTSVDLKDNNITLLPKDFPYDRLSMQIEGNHIREVPEELQDDKYNYIQDITIRYSDPDNIQNPPILKQYVDYLLKNDYLYDVAYGSINTTNYSFGDSLSNGFVRDSNNPSYVWVHRYSGR